MVCHCLLRTDGRYYWVSTARLPTFNLLGGKQCDLRGGAENGAASSGTRVRALMRVAANFIWFWWLWVCAPVVV
jgi:hypothetical protein